MLDLTPEQQAAHAQVVRTIVDAKLSAQQGRTLEGALHAQVTAIGQQLDAIDATPDRPVALSQVTAIRTAQAQLAGICDILGSIGTRAAIPFAEAAEVEQREVLRYRDLIENGLGLPELRKELGALVLAIDTKLGHLEGGAGAYLAAQASSIEGVRAISVFVLVDGTGVSEHHTYELPTDAEWIRGAMEKHVRDEAGALITQRLTVSGVGPDVIVLADTQNGSEPARIPVHYGRLDRARLGEVAKHFGKDVQLVLRPIR